ncbi:zinc-binding dehydrogenase [Micromonospora sp. C28SCA-DRY-2]|uniref:zinc-binding dehydrogenase n=1 Tax=Micromonospora sp. C28SCA-DRY-2 TaxID=3059522 RepID=UPI0026754435|nr:zinc-binding dehydrogenase [Micromonospora sp. C28SCA-DRY-2]MDO3705241.1 zinc-binding dehydrogenase [Micromonospora sp. C28SCA-DRY-2]
MRVVEVTAFGGPEVLTLAEAPEPVPGPGEVVVEVAAADVLWVETMIRRGEGGAYFPVRPPYRPGVGVAGTVGAVGAGVDPGWSGRRVVTRTDERGGYLERAVVPVDGVLPVPDAVPLTDAAALLHDGVTAFGLLDLVPVGAGDRVLVTAAAGGLGAILVQEVRATGGIVVAAARGPAKLDALRRLGADVVVDYDEPGWTDRVRAAAGEVDVVFDGAGGDYGRAAFDLVRAGGRFSAHGTPAGAFAVPDPEVARARRIAVTGIADVQFTPEQARRHLRAALDAAAAGRIAPLIGRTFPLERAADAHRAVEGRAVVGKALLTV